MHSSWLCRQHLGGLSRPRHLPAAFVIEPAIRIRSSFSVAQAERWPDVQELQVKLSGMWVALMLTSVMSSGSTAATSSQERSPAAQSAGRS